MTEIQYVSHLRALCTASYTEEVITVRPLKFDEAENQPIKEKS